MSLRGKKPGKKRKVLSKNKKWDLNSNWVAYLYYRVQYKHLKEKIAKRLGVRLSQFDSKIQKYKSLEKNSKNKSSKVTKDVKFIFKNNKYLSDQQCLLKLEDWLTHKQVSFGVVSTQTKITHKSDEQLIHPPKDFNIDHDYEKFWNLKKQLQNIRLEELPWNDFIKAVSLLNIKSRGMKIEKRIIANNPIWRKSKQKEEGDAWLGNMGIEIKTSFITPLKGSKVSLTGLKLWEEKVLFYLLLVIDLKTDLNTPTTYAMWVPRKALLKADKKGLTNFPGMKKKVSENNLYVQRGLSLSTDLLKKWATKHPLPEDINL